MTADRIQVLRTIDKWDRNGPEGTFDLLTTGKMDQSGAFIPGCGLDNAQALFLTAFVGSVSHPKLMNRLLMLEVLESTQTGEWTTALDDLLHLKHENYAWQLDDLIAIAQGREPPPSAADWDFRGFLKKTAEKAAKWR